MKGPNHLIANRNRYLLAEHHDLDQKTGLSSDPVEDWPEENSVAFDLANDLEEVEKMEGFDLVIGPAEEMKAGLPEADDLVIDPEEEHFDLSRMNDLVSVLNLEMMTNDLDWKEALHFGISNRSPYLYCYHADLFQGPNLEPTRRLCKSQGHQGLIGCEGFSFAFYCTTSSDQIRFTYLYTLMGLSAILGEGGTSRNRFAKRMEGASTDI